MHYILLYNVIINKQFRYLSIAYFKENKDIATVFPSLRWWSTATAWLLRFTFCLARLSSGDIVGFI
jgi:hypothetical protein